MQRKGDVPMNKCYNQYKTDSKIIPCSKVPIYKLEKGDLFRFRGGKLDYRFYELIFIGPQFNNQKYYRMYYYDSAGKFLARKTFDFTLVYKYNLC